MRKAAATAVSGLVLLVAGSLAAVGPGAAAPAATNQLVSHSSASLTGGANNSFEQAVISADGRWVAFRSAATNLIDGFSDNTGPGGSSIFLFDSMDSSLRLVNHVPGNASATGNGFAQAPVISNDGTYVVYESAASDLVTGYTDNNFTGLELYLYDVEADTTTLISHRHDDPLEGGNERTVQWGGRAALSADNRFIAYRSEATDLVTGFTDNNGGTEEDLYLYNVEDGTNRLITHAHNDPTQGADAPIEENQITFGADGRFLTFMTDATNVVAYTDTNGATPEAFLFDRTTSSSRLLSHAQGAPNTSANGAVQSVAISANGKRVVFESIATDLITNFTDNSGSGTSSGWDVYIHDVNKNTHRLVSFAKGVSNTTGNRGGFNGTTPFISDNGKRIAYESGATDIVPFQFDSNSTQDDIFVWSEVKKNGKKRYKNTFVTPSVNHESQNQNGIATLWGFSGDGSTVLYSTAAGDAVNGVVDGNVAGGDMYRWSASKKASTLVSVSESDPGKSANADSSGVPFSIRTVSADGKALIYQSAATDLVPSFGNNNAGQADLFRFGP